MMNAVDTEKLVFSQLLLFGFKHHSAGFRYLCTGLQLALVESSMRRAIVDAYEHGNCKDQFHKIFLRYTHECPTVSEFMTGNVHRLLYGDI